MKKLFLLSALFLVVVLPGISCATQSSTVGCYEIPYRILHVGEQYLNVQTGTYNADAVFFMAPEYVVDPVSSLPTGQPTSINYYVTMQGKYSNIFVAHNMTHEEFEHLQGCKTMPDTGGQILYCKLPISNQAGTCTQILPILVEDSVRPLTVTEQVAAYYKDSKAFTSAVQMPAARDYRQISVKSNDEGVGLDGDLSNIVDLKNYFTNPSGATDSFTFSAGSGTGNANYLCEGLTGTKATFCADHPAVYLAKFGQTTAANYLTYTDGAVGDAHQSIGQVSACSAGSRFVISGDELSGQDLCSGIYQLNIKATSSNGNFAYTSLYVNVSPSNPTLAQWQNDTASPVSNLFSLNNQNLSPIYTYPPHNRSPLSNKADPQALQDFLDDQTNYAQDLKYINAHLLGERKINVVLPSVSELMFNSSYVGNKYPNWGQMPADCNTDAFNNGTSPVSCVPADGVETSYESVAGKNDAAFWQPLIADVYNETNAPGVSVAADYSFDNGINAMFHTFTPQQAAYVAATLLNVALEGGLVGSSLDPEHASTSNWAVQAYARMSNMFFYHGLWLGYYYFATGFPANITDALAPAGLPFYSAYDATKYRAPQTYSTSPGGHSAFPLQGSPSDCGVDSTNPAGCGQDWSIANSNRLFTDGFEKSSQCYSSKDGVVNSGSYCSLSANDLASGNHMDLWQASEIYVSSPVKVSPLTAAYNFDAAYTDIVPLGASATGWTYDEIWNPNFAPTASTKAAVLQSVSDCTDMSYSYLKANAGNFVPGKTPYNALTQCLLGNVFLSNSTTGQHINVFRNTEALTADTAIPTPSEVVTISKCTFSATQNSYSCQITMSWKPVSGYDMNVDVYDGLQHKVVVSKTGITADTISFNVSTLSKGDVYLMQLDFSKAGEKGIPYSAGFLEEAGTPPQSVALQTFEPCKKPDGSNYPYYQCILVRGTPSNYDLTLGSTTPLSNVVRGGENAIQNVVAAAQKGNLNIYPYTRHMVGFGAFAIEDFLSSPIGGTQPAAPTSEGGYNAQIGEPWYSAGKALTGLSPAKPHHIVGEIADPFSDTPQDKALLLGEWTVMRAALDSMYTQKTVAKGKS